MWYYVSQGASVGPVDAEEMARKVQTGEVGPATPVWREGMADWQEARLTELFRAEGGPPPPPPGRPLAPPVASDDVTLPVMAHVLGLLTGFLGPLILYLVGTDPRAKEHARNALNWQISLIIYAVVCIPLVFFFIGVFLIIALGILDLVFCITAAIRAGNRQPYTYPMTIPFVS